MKFMKNEEEAVEVMQEVFAKALKHADSFRGESSPYTWLYQITTHLCLNKIRHVKVTKIIDQPFDEAVHEKGSHPESQIVQSKLFRDAFEVLDEKDKRILTLYYIDGMTQEEVGQALGISRKTIYHRLMEISRRLKKAGLENAV